jgi:hypothetical protein
MLTTISWTDPTLNVDGSPIGPSEITAYEVGARDTSASGSQAGVYPYGVKAPPTSTSALLAALTPLLPTGVPLVFAVRADTAGLDANGQPIESAWSVESTAITLPVPAPVPNPPTGVTLS